MLRSNIMLLSLTACVATSALLADVTLPKIFSDRMVLQRELPVPVWGWAAPGEKVAVAFAGQVKETTAGPDGKWRVKLAPLETSSTPAELSVTGKNTVKLKNVLVGEVWLCSGQSNMNFPVADTKNSAAEISSANYCQR